MHYWFFPERGDISKFRMTLTQLNCFNSNNRANFPGLTFVSSDLSLHSTLSTMFSDLLLHSTLPAMFSDLLLHSTLPTMFSSSPSTPLVSHPGTCRTSRFRLPVLLSTLAVKTTKQGLWFFKINSKKVSNIRYIYIINKFYSEKNNAY